MATNFIFSINAVMPLFIIVLVGYIMKSRGLMDSIAVKKINAVVFNAALPVMLFRDISKSDFFAIFDLRLLMCAVGATLLIFALCCMAGPFFVPERKSQGAFIQGSFRGNYAIIGLPLIANLLGSQNTGKGSLITTFVVPLYNILAICILSAKGKGTDTGLLKNAVFGIIKNPLIIGICIGIPFSVLQIKLPEALNTTVNYLANATTPCALLAIGASIDFGQFRRKLKPAVIASAIKLVAGPLVFTPFGYLLGLRGENLVIFYIMLAAPTAVGSYIMADTMGSDGELAANIVLLTTISSTFTCTLGVFVLKSLGAI